MADMYSYKGRDSMGQLMTGSIEADNEAAVASFLRNKGYFVTGITKHKKERNIATIINIFNQVKTKDLAVFCRQFAVMIDAGLSLLTCINILLEQTTNSRLKVALKMIYRDVQGGQTLSEAMKVHADIFPNMMVSMVEAGELGGVLDLVMNRLAVHFEKEHKMNEKVKSALTYPAVVLTMAILVVGFILTFVLPIFLGIYSNMPNLQLPVTTKLLVGISGFLNRNLGYVVAVLCFSGLSIYKLWEHPQFKKVKERVVFYLPVFGMLSRKIMIARFSRTLGTLIKSGVPVISALEVVKKTTEHNGMIGALTQAQESIRQGVGLASPLASSAIFTPMVIQMLAVGEETGEVDQMLEKIADFYESEVEDVVGRLSSMLEPFLIGFLGIVIGLILISVVSPMFDAITNIGSIH